MSVLIVNYRGAEDTIDCVAALRTLAWPAERLQVVVVDNASGDDSVDRIRAAAPDITLIESHENRGFAGGCNLAVRHAEGEFIALINSDARPDPAWLTEAVAVLRAEHTVAAVASKVLTWDGERIDYVGGHVNFIGQGYKPEAGHRDTGEFDTEKDVLFPTGSGAIIRASVYRRLGGFDERYFMFFEDLDLGWRMNLQGLRVRYVPASVVYHKHHSAIAKFGAYREQYLLARNGLLTIFKNFDDETLATALAPALLLTVRASLELGSTDPNALDLQSSNDDDDDPSITVDKQSLTGAFAVDYLMRNLAELTEQRAKIQTSRTRSDAALAPLFGDLLMATGAPTGYHDAWQSAVRTFRLDERLLPRRRIAVVTADTLSPQMAGPAIRAFHIADELANEHDVTLASTTMCSIDNARFDCVKVSDSELRRVAERAEIIVFQGFVMHHAPWLRDLDKIIIVDLYDPMHLEQLEQRKDILPADRAIEVASTTEVLNAQLERGDFFLCASEEQRHFWLGQLAAVGRLNPANYDRDSSLRSLLAVSPFGMPSEPPVSKQSAIKGVVPGIGITDKVILWGGGVYNWFDPLTLIRAVDLLRTRHDDIRLFFLGMQHPNPNVPAMHVAWETRQLCDELDITDRFVFFNEKWVPYHDRVNYLCDADVGASTHFLHVETTFAFRTRILDYLWAGLPIVATEGDVFARLVANEKLGAVVPERDFEALAAALERVLYDEQFDAECRANIERIREQFAWNTVLTPLTDFCRRAEPAADRTLRESNDDGEGRSPQRLPAPMIVRRLHIMQAESGTVGAARRLAAAARRRLASQTTGR